jgi:hypothetical protein
MTRSSRFVVAALGSLLLSAPVHAQLAVGGHFGWLFDTEEDRFSIGADARYTLKDKRWALNPRFTYYLWSEGASGWQVDGNVLYRFSVAGSEKVEPYAGLGVGFISTSFDSGLTDVSDSKVAANLISGFNVKTSSRVKPWVHFQYTAAMDFGNLFIGFIGVSVPVGK